MKSSFENQLPYLSDNYAEVYIPPSDFTSHPFQKPRNHPNIVEEINASHLMLPPKRSYRLNLHPGHYTVNIQLRSKSNPFRIVFSPSRDAGEGRGIPPKYPEPLVYNDSLSSPYAAFPQKVVHKASRPSHSMAQSCQVASSTHSGRRTSRHRQRREKYRWASILCLHPGNFDDSLSELSGCDSFSGYEGVEHLKRSSVDTALITEDSKSSGNNNNYNNNAVIGSNNNVSSSYYNFINADSDFNSLSLNSDSNFAVSVSDPLTCFDNYFPFNYPLYHFTKSGFSEYEKSSLPLSTVSCSALITSHGGKPNLSNEQVNNNSNKRSSWRVDEAFLRQVVKEYFSEPSLEFEAPYEYCVANEPKLKRASSDEPRVDGNIKQGVTQSTSELYLNKIHTPVAHIIPLQSCRKISSSCVISKTNSLLETAKESSPDDTAAEPEQFKVTELTLDETLVDRDETLSWNSDDSRGYEADLDLSDKENYGMVFWREWKSAPTVCSGSEVTDGTSYGRSKEAADDDEYRPTLDGRAKPTVDVRQLASSQRSFGYVPRKSNSVGDARYPNCFVGVEKIMMHKLKRFLDDISIDSRVINEEDNIVVSENKFCNVAIMADEIKLPPTPHCDNIEETDESDFTSSDATKNSSSSSDVKFEYVNKKYYGINYLSVLPEHFKFRKTSDTSFDDELSAGNAEKALSEGLVFTQSEDNGVSSIVEEKPFQSNADVENFELTDDSVCDSVPEGNHSVRYEPHKNCENLLPSDNTEVTGGAYGDSLNNLNKNRCEGTVGGDDCPIYYNLKHFYSKNRRKKKKESLATRESKMKHVNGDVWQPEEIPSCCISLGKFSSRSHGSGNMASSPTAGHRSARYVSDFTVTGPCGSWGNSVGRVQVRGTQRSATRVVEPTTQRSELHVPPKASLLYRHGTKNEKSRSTSEVNRVASPLQHLPTQVSRNKVSEYIMGNIQAGKENNIRATEDTVTNCSKPTKRRSGGSRTKSRKHFNSFLESFGSSGGLSKNSLGQSSQEIDKEKNISATNDISYKNKDSFSFRFVTANKVKSEKNVEKQQSSADASSESCHSLLGSHMKEGWKQASEHTSSASSVKKKVKEYRNHCDDPHIDTSSAVVSDVHEGDGLRKSSCNKQKDVDVPAEYPVYENVVFRKHRYVGKFSYINSLIQSSETDGEESFCHHGKVETKKKATSDQPHDTKSTVPDAPKNTLYVPVPSDEDCGIETHRCAISVPRNSCDHLKSYASHTCESEEHGDKTPYFDLEQLYEDFKSAKGSQTSVAVTGNCDEFDDDDDSADKIPISHSASSASVASDTSSFYYTAGGPALYEALDAVAAYFSVAEKTEDERKDSINSESLKQFAFSNSTADQQINIKIKDKYEKILKSEDFNESAGAEERNISDSVQIKSKSDCSEVTDSTFASCVDKRCKVPKRENSESEEESNELKRDHSESEEESNELKRENSESKRENIDSEIENSESKRESSESKIENSDSKRENIDSEIENSESKRESSESKRENSDSKRESSESELESKRSSSFHEYANANVLITDDKILVTLQPSHETVNIDALKPKLAVSSCGIESIVENRVNVDDGKNDVTREVEAEREDLVRASTCVLFSDDEEIDLKFSRHILPDELGNDVCATSNVQSSKSDLNEGSSFSGVARAFPCWVFSEPDTLSVSERLEGIGKNDDSLSQVTAEGKDEEEQEDLLESYYCQFAQGKDGFEPELQSTSDSRTEETLTTEPEVSSVYAAATMSEPADESFDEIVFSPANSECRRTPDGYRNSPFSSSEGVSELSGESETLSDRSSHRTSEYTNSVSWENSAIESNGAPRSIFRVPLSGPTFPSRRHTFQFTPDHNVHTVRPQTQRMSNPDFPPVVVSMSLSPSSPADAKKPPRSPSHRGRDSNSMPREGRSRCQTRRRCRSVSSGGSSATSKQGGDTSPPHPRPSSLISVSKGCSSSSQESLHDLPLRFSPALEDRAPDTRWLAERKKHEGNESYKHKDYREALKLYTEAIELCPECAPYYSNRSASYMMLGKYTQALADAREAVRLDSTFVKGYIRIAKCNVALGDATAAMAVLRQAIELEPGNKALRDESANAEALLKYCDDAEKAANRKDYRMAIFYLDRALNLAAGCRSLKITKAEYLAYLQRYAEAQEIVNEILQYDSSDVDAVNVRGMCLYYQNNHETAFTHFQHVLRLAPDHKKARDLYKKAKLLRQKKDEGNQAFNRGNLPEALNIYTEALSIDPHNTATNSKLYCNRATVRAKIGKLEEAVEDCTAAINLDEGYVKAFLRRAKCYQDLEMHEEAVRDYEKAFKLDRNQENKRLLHEAKTQLKRSKWKDYYKILGVTKSASEEEIKKSYKKMALQHHPDRHANASDKEKQEHEVKFKEIGEAYTVLTDSKKKAMYDRGQDVNSSDSGLFHDDVDPNQIFQAFFGPGGSNFGYGDYIPGGFSGGSFPGGFHFQFG